MVVILQILPEKRKEKQENETAGEVRSAATPNRTAQQYSISL